MEKVLVKQIDFFAKSRNSFYKKFFEPTQSELTQFNGYGFSEKIFGEVEFGKDFFFPYSRISKEAIASAIVWYYKGKRGVFSVVFQNAKIVPYYLNTLEQNSCFVLARNGLTFIFRLKRDKIVEVPEILKDNLSLKNFLNYPKPKQAKNSIFKK